MLISLLFFGLVLGVRHALEADHVAAVAALASRARSFGDYVKLAGAWGVGHAVAIVLFGSAVIALGVSLPEAVARGFEVAVGVVLIALGIDVLRRVRRERVHFHVHDHGDGHVHVHAHAHDSVAKVHDAAAHQHAHPQGALRRAVFVGGVHGLSGSAALLLLPLAGNGSVAQAVAYLAVFGIGTIIGMILFSVSLAVPLRLSARHLGSTLRVVEATLGVVTVAIGCWVTVGALAGSGGG
jgi:sulfite exporter TauE/SafE